jgi:hypothetical protein
VTSSSGFVSTVLVRSPARPCRCLSTSTFVTYPLAARPRYRTFALSNTRRRPHRVETFRQRVVGPANQARIRQAMSTKSLQSQASYERANPCTKATRCDRHQRQFRAALMANLLRGQQRQQRRQRPIVAHRCRVRRIRRMRCMLPLRITNDFRRATPI